MPVAIAVAVYSEMLLVLPGPIRLFPLPVVGSSVQAAEWVTSCAEASTLTAVGREIVVTLDVAIVFFEHFPGA